ncbi:DUF4225 domain-containing protein [Affinibrenneria salicis]|uniref:DUF4225 domain-containing protein n=1 Tax=Affinibrenneria salicis TaxID=2590031 RepID=A0A5J5FXS5_9GAMM|nr:DUF4225 domain-containing protein [Affinibrenneria salicis]KAA8998912.1 DUF4225 domain-containing protein [Affinibrenneria salicis]
MCFVENKYVKQSLVNDNFIKDVTSYALEINSRVNVGRISVPDAIREVDEEIASLNQQDESLSEKKKQQTLILAGNARQRTTQNFSAEWDKLIVAGIGIVSGALQTMAGLALIETGPAGALMLAHGVSNTIENGYYILIVKIMSVR